jgi:hypothetical protein
MPKRLFAEWGSMDTHNLENWHRKYNIKHPDSRELQGWVRRSAIAAFVIAAIAFSVVFGKW